MKSLSKKVHAAVLLMLFISLCFHHGPHAADGTPDDLAFVDRTAAVELLSSLSVSKNIVHGVIYSRQGDIFTAYERPDQGKKQIRRGYHVYGNVAR